MRFSVCAVASMGTLFSACTTVQQSRTMTIYPTGAAVTVTSNADARCWDVFAVIWCRVNLQLESSDGQRPSPRLQPEPAPARAPLSRNASDRTRRLTERLATLRDRYSRNLISAEEYNREKEKVIKELQK